MVNEIDKVMNGIQNTEASVYDLARMKEHE